MQHYTPITLSTACVWTRVWNGTDRPAPEKVVIITDKCTETKDVCTDALIHLQLVSNHVLHNGSVTKWTTNNLYISDSLRLSRGCKNMATVAFFTFATLFWVWLVLATDVIDAYSIGLKNARWEHRLISRWVNPVTQTADLRSSNITDAYCSVCLENRPTERWDHSV